MIVSCEEMRRIEQAAFARGISAQALMEEAGRQMACAVRQFFPRPGVCRVFFGKGHNGGDALVAARHLAAAGWQIELAPAFPPEALAPLPRKQLEAFPAIRPLPSPPAAASHVVLDGLLGIGARGPLGEPIRTAAAEINRLRHQTGATVFAIDLPTGLDGDTGEAAPDAIVADFTLCAGFAKRGLLADAALDHVGRLAVMPLPDLAAPTLPGRETVATPQNLAPLLPPRAFHTHKGECGRVGIVAGSRGFTGAALMAAHAAVRAGAGLVSLFVTPDIYPVVAPAAMPEVMVTPVDCYLAVLDRPLNVLAIGPGLGQADAPDILAVIEYFKGPAIVDADALNLLAQNPAPLHRAAAPRLLTPHPGEMQRLFPQSARLTRRETVETFLAPFAGNPAPLTLLLKGARTLVGQCDASGCRLSWNTTGTPGMATGGMGDVLTGACAALAAQGPSLFDAARLGAWLCGRAAELAIASGEQSVESLAATDLLHRFGRAFADLRLPTSC